MFKTKEISDFYKNHSFNLFYKSLHEKAFKDSKEILKLIEAEISKLTSGDELILNDIYLLKQILLFHNSLMLLWEDIYQEKYSSSWNNLQTCFDRLRNINKFSLNNQKTKELDFFEKQLLIIEKLYPYNIFMSMGMETSLFECSICGKNIDSFECEHDICELYYGEMAFGIAKEITDINHISVVENPMDKRCVVQYHDNGHQFKGLQFLNKQLISNQLTPITIYDADETPRKILNDNYIKLERNEKCFCGSDKKFKKCCMNKEYTEEKHIELIVNHEFKLW
jgi:hypothetical protein